MLNTGKRLACFEQPKKRTLFATSSPVRLAGKHVKLRMLDRRRISSCQIPHVGFAADMPIGA
jgi:hypothetical protein